MHVFRVKGGIKGRVEYEDGASAAKIDIIISMGSWRKKMCTCAHMYSQSCEYKGGRTMHPMQYLTLQQCIFFYNGQFTLSVLTNLTPTDHFSSTIFIKTNEGHMLIGIHYKFYDCVHTSMQL